jgi:hypothetical protein
MCAYGSLEGEGTGAAAFNHLLNSYKTGSYFVGVPKGGASAREMAL